MAARITASLTFLQHILAEVVRPGDLAVDATVGNGHDTALLARLVGPSGLVHGFDVQAEAIESAGRLLAAAGLAERVRLHAQGHERLAEVLPQADHGRAAAVVFNLGYLPGGDETRVTRPETTLAALEGSREILAPGGVVALACLALAFQARDKLLGKSSLLIFAASAGKVLLFDLAEATPLVRIACLVVLGVTLYAGGWMYRKVDAIETESTTTTT